MPATDHTPWSMTGPVIPGPVIATPATTEPTPSMQPYEIHHDPVAHRFTARVEGLEAEVTYHYDGEVLVINHTGVPRPLEGRGIASALVRAVFDFAHEVGAKVRPACSYAATWVERHTQYAHLLA